MSFEKIKTGNTIVSSLRQINNNFDLLDTEITQVKDLLIEHEETQSELRDLIEQVDKDLIEIDNRFSQQVIQLQQDVVNVQNVVNDISNIEENDIDNLFS